MNLRLSTKILLRALANIVLLGLLFVIFLRLQVGDQLESLLLSPARDRIQAIANGVALEFRNFPQEDNTERGNSLLEQYSKLHGLIFLLTDNDGHRIAGPEMELPPPVMRRLTERPPRPEGNRPKGPPPGESRKDPFPGEGPEGEAPPRKSGPPPKKKQGGKGLRPPGNNQVFLVTNGSEPRYWVGVRIPVPHPDGDGIVPATLFLISPTLWSNRFYFDFRPWLIIASSALGLSVLCWLPFIRSLTSSIGAMSQATEQIAKGHFEIQLPQTRHDELGALSESINSLSAQLSQFVSGQKRFLGDVAHELCAPIARIQFAIGILEARATPETEAYIADLSSEIQHMSSLVNELLAFSKAGLQPKEVKLESVALAPLIERVLQREGQGNSQIEIDVPGDIAVLTAPDYLFRAISNLLRNAIRYAGHAGPIEIQARKVEGEEGAGAIELHIRDHGPGLPEDPSQRPVGGHGLGLQIAKACVEACRGSLRFHNRQPAGLELTLRFAATAAPRSASERREGDNS